MNDTNETNEKKFQPVIINVGYDDETRPVRFTGRLIGEATNRWYEGPNQNRWHVWELYELPSEKYRVVDRYFTQWRGATGHTSLSDALFPREVADKYPRLANKYFRQSEIVMDLGEDDAGIPGNPDRDY
jgi:hypothetical protein